MDFKTFEIDGQKYTLDNPVDLLLSWALESAGDEFRSKESLDRIATVLKAVCPTIPDRYFCPMDGYTIPLIDSYQIMDFVAKLLIHVTEKRVKAIEAISEEDKATLNIDVDKKATQFRQAIEQMSKEFTKVRFDLILGGVQINTTEDDSQKDSSIPVVATSSTEPQIAILKRQLEVLNSEISSLEKV